MVVKISTIAAFFVALSALTIGYIIAQFGPYGYNMVDNYISDMGSIKYTPFPYMRTIANVGSGPLFMPVTFYIKKRLASEKVADISKNQLLLGKVGFYGMLTIFLGMMCTGIITEDVSMLIHVILAIIAILGGFIATIFYGLLIVKYSTVVPEIVGVIMLLMFPVLGILLYVGFPSRIFYEWVLLFSLYAWIITCSIYLLNIE